jgi:23S rRNA U2552 (ribose-2'-O)-methylase RlmE/FtsJ
MSDLIKPPWTHFSWKTHARWYPTPAAAEVDAEIYTPDTLKVAKNQIAACAPHHMWEYAKKICNPYELVYTYRDAHIPASLSVVKPLSRSYFKMIEMLDLTKFLQQRQHFRTAHVCEGPGGFIEAIYEVAGKQEKRIRSTHAMTLKSTKSHIPGWRRAQNFMNRHRQINIEYGADGTGDIFNPDNKAAFISEVRAQGGIDRPIHIFTADGGFDFTSNYLAQETSIYRLLAASIQVGLSVLAVDGMFVLKIFDLFAPATYQLIGWLASCFGRWTLYKPATSRPCNSEQYFIGIGFRGITDAELEHLGCVAEMPRRLFNEDVPAPLYDALKAQSDFMLAKQLQFLNTATMSAQQWTLAAPSEQQLGDLWSQVHDTSVSLCRRFHIIHTYPLPPIRCRFSLPATSSYESDVSDVAADPPTASLHCPCLLHDQFAGSVADCAAYSAPPDVCLQSSTPDDVSVLHSPSAASSSASCEDHSDPRLQSTSEIAPDRN